MRPSAEFQASWRNVKEIIVESQKYLKAEACGLDYDPNLGKGHV